MVPATRVPLDTSRTANTIRAPAPASCLAAEAPIPLDAPVITTVLPDRSGRSAAVHLWPEMLAPLKSRWPLASPLAAKRSGDLSLRPRGPAALKYASFDHRWPAWNHRCLSRPSISAPPSRAVHLVARAGSMPGQPHRAAGESAGLNQLAAPVRHQGLVVQPRFSLAPGYESRRMDLDMTRSTFWWRSPWPPLERLKVGQSISSGSGECSVLKAVTTVPQMCGMELILKGPTTSGMSTIAWAKRVGALSALPLEG